MGHPLGARTPSTQVPFVESSVSRYVPGPALTIVRWLHDTACGRRRRVSARNRRAARRGASGAVICTRERRYGCAWRTLRQRQAQRAQRVHRAAHVHGARHQRVLLRQQARRGRALRNERAPRRRGGGDRRPRRPLRQPRQLATGGRWPPRHAEPRHGGAARGQSKTRGRADSVSTCAVVRNGKARGRESVANGRAVHGTARGCGTCGHGRAVHTRMLWLTPVRATHAAAARGAPGRRGGGGPASRGTPLSA